MPSAPGCLARGRSLPSPRVPFGATIPRRRMHHVRSSRDTDLLGDCTFSTPCDCISPSQPLFPSLPHHPGSTPL